MLRGFYFITDAGLSRKGIFSDVKEAISAGVCAVQYRSKNRSTRVMIDECMVLRDICNKTPLIINDRVDVALAVKADGVHLGQSDMHILKARELIGNNKIIGITVHSLEEAQEAEKSGADYLGISPIFATNTKHDAGKAAGVELISSIKSKSALPLVAIAGINLTNAEQVIDAGADAICAVSAVIDKDNVGLEVSKFNALFRDRPS